MTSEEGRVYSSMTDPLNQFILTAAQGAWSTCGNVPTGIAVAYLYAYRLAVFEW